MRDKVLEESIYLYIKEHENDNIDTVDITTKFQQYNPDKLMISINHLRVNKKIQRESIGLHYKYTILN